MRPNLVVNPLSDEVFVAATNQIAGNGIETATELEQALREQFPRVVVHERLLTGERTPTWYVYRDGAWVRS